MIFTKILFLLFLTIFLVSCNTKVNNTTVNDTNEVNSATIAKVKKKKKIVYNKSDKNWKKKKQVDDLITQLAAKEWSERENAQGKLQTLVNSNKSPVLDYMFLRTAQQNDPEIVFRAKKVQKQYFDEIVYNPNRKKGFIGLQLAPAGPRIFQNKTYRPIRIVIPQLGFPGIKAGIKANDLIMAVDSKKCDNKFLLNDFIRYIAKKDPGNEILLLILRANKIIKIKVKLTERPKTTMSSIPEKSQQEQFKEWRMGKE